MTNPNDTTDTSRKHKNIPSDADSDNDNGPDPPKTLKDNAGNRSRAPFSSSCGGGGGDDDGPVRILHSVTPLKSKNDPNDYKVLHLSNGLRVCLISRKEPGFWRVFFDLLFGRLQNKTNQKMKMKFQFWNWFSSVSLDFTHVALSVNVGGLDDPEDAEGLAHFLEHVVHFGSKQFPREEEFHELTFHLGTGNAFTTPMTTYYYCIVVDSVLEKSLRIFSEMHTNPKMELDLIQREVNAVDSEFYFRQPYFRRQLLHSQIGGYQKGHPLRRLWIGKMETLGGGDANGSKLVQERMKESHRENYVASAMGLVLNSTKSIEELEQLTLKHFSKLQKGERQIQRETEVDDKWKLPNEPQHIFLQGISSVAELSLFWHLPPSLWLDDIHEMTMEVIESLLLTSSPKGLLFHLKEEELIWGAYVFSDLTPYGIIFELTFLLTTKGREAGQCHIQKATDDYIRFLQNIREGDLSKYFDQMRICKLRDFHYGFQDASLNSTISCVDRLQYLEDFQEIVNFGSWENAKFNYARIMDALAVMRVKDATVIETIPKDIPIEKRWKEGLFKTVRYFTAPKEPLRFKRDFTNVFAFEPVNRYLREDLLLLRKKNEESGGGGDMHTTSKWNLVPLQNIENIWPQALKHESPGDESLALPKISGYHSGHFKTSLAAYLALVEMHFIMPAYRSSSPRGSALLNLWAFYIGQRLSKLETESAFAGNLFSVQVEEDTGTLTLNIVGFPGNIEEISRKCMEHVFDPHRISDSTYALAKEEMRNNLETRLGNGGLTVQLVLMILFANKTDLTVDTLGILEELTINDLRCFIEGNRKCTRCLIELSGNVPIKLFHSLACALGKIDFAPWLDSSPNSSKRFLTPRHNLFTPGETCIRVRNAGNCTFTNRVTNLYILGRLNEREKAVKGRHGTGSSSCPPKSGDCFQAAMAFIHQKAFAFLRTQRQLAYVVGAGPVMFGQGIMVFYVEIVATAKNHTVCELDQNIDEFLSEYGTLLRNMPNEIYDKTNELEEFKVTKEEAASWFNSKFGPDFSRTDQCLKCLMRGVRKVSIQEIGTGNPISKPKTCDCDVCRGIQEWMKGRNHNSSLEFAVGNNEYYNYFVRF